jgi:hypothetical protein
VVSMGPVTVSGTARGAALGLALILALAGCDSAPDPSAATPASGAARKAAPPKSDDVDMVTAFSVHAAGQPGLVDLKFKLSKHPVVGEPVDIDLQLIPTVELERLFAHFQVGDGLQIVSGAESQHFEHPARGTPVGHKMTVTAKADGIFYVTAVVLADSDKESVARTFSFPVIAGEGLLGQPAAASVADPKQAPARP